jgi:DNA mismatch repair protein MutL
VEVRVEGGRILHVKQAGAPVGTLIEAGQLFFNTPARRKFLKTIATEIGHIADIVAGMALGHPEVHLRLMHNGKPVKQWLRTDDAAARAAEVLSVPPGDLLPVDTRSGPLALRGWLVLPRLARSTTRGSYLFVNGRRVRDRVVQHALMEGYGGRLMKGRFPAGVLFLELPFEQVDVNVHPTKHEIRFAQARQIHQFVQAAIAATLARAETPRLRGDGERSADVRDPAAVAEPLPEYLKALDVDWAERTTLPASAAREPLGRIAASPAAAEGGLENPAPARPAAEQQPLWRPRRFADLIVIGQLRGTYIVCQDGADLLLIDQHAAHERIVYEALRQAAGRPESQYLLVPETVELGFGEAAALVPLIPRLAELGLAIEPFGGTTFAIKAVPALLDQCAAGRLVLDLAEKAVQMGQEADLSKRIDECRMIMACHHAVRANQHLAAQQIAHMLARLDGCENASHCPHGRPTWIRWSGRQIEKAFGRSA